MLISPFPSKLLHKGLNVAYSEKKFPLQGCSHAVVDTRRRYTVLSVFLFSVKLALLGFRALGPYQSWQELALRWGAM